MKNEIVLTREEATLAAQLLENGTWVNDWSDHQAEKLSKLIQSKLAEASDEK